ncbi:hypothetical protein CDCA_CDCA16G4242 [Cyanidium caldarium]|uniref:PROP1-like PPR domain-containing protein n=1 Tax=Cyanidium caldarium TaxID=2771 RepID=A0AAV9J0V1_CYACA|nr:hypothetical protein CDCA_CDCA16G4242 [Cyanidium caldarium]
MFVTPVGLAPSRCRGERRQVGGPLRRFSVRRGGGCARLAWAMRHRERSQPTDEEAVDGGPGWELEETLGERQQNVAEDDELLRTLEGDLASRSAAGGGSVGEVDAAYVGLFERAAQLTARLRAEQDSAGGAGSPRPLFVPASMNVTPFVMDADGDGRKAAANLLARVRRVSGDVDVELPSYEEPPLSMPTRRPAVMSVAGDNGRSEPPPPGTPGRPSAAGDVDSVMPPPATTSRRSHREANASRVSLLELTILAQQRQLDEPLPPLPRPSMSAEAAAELYAEFRAALYAGMRGSKATPQSGSWPLTKTAASATRYLLRALELVRSNNISAYLTTVELSDLMLGFCRLRLLPRVMEAFKLVTALGLQHTPKTYSVLIDALCKSRRVEAAMYFFDKYVDHEGAEAAARRPGQRACLPPTVVMYNTLIAGFARSQRLDMALAYYARLKASPWRLRPDRFTFSTLLDACARACDIERALQLFEEMQALGVHADEVVYATVMDAAGRAGRRRLAMALAGLMVRRGLPPNDIIMAMLIGSCAADGACPQAFALFRQLRQWGWRPTAHAYTNLIVVCCQSGRPHLAMVMLSMMRRDGLRPSGITYAELVNGWAACDRLDRAFGVVREMRRDRFEPNTLTLNALLEACRRCGNLQAAHWVYVAMQRELRARRALLADATAATASNAAAMWPAMSREPNAATYATMIRLASDLGQHRLAVMHYLRDAIEQGLLNSHTYRTTLAGCIRELCEASLPELWEAGEGRTRVDLDAEAQQVLRQALRITDLDRVQVE